MMKQPPPILQLATIKPFLYQNNSGGVENFLWTSFANMLDT